MIRKRQSLICTNESASDSDIYAQNGCVSFPVGGHFPKSVFHASFERLFQIATSPFDNVAFPRSEMALRRPSIKMSEKNRPEIVSLS